MGVRWGGVGGLSGSGCTRTAECVSWRVAKCYTAARLAGTTCRQIPVPHCTGADRQTYRQTDSHGRTRQLKSGVCGPQPRVPQSKTYKKLHKTYKNLYKTYTNLYNTYKKHIKTYTHLYILLYFAMFCPQIPVPHCTGADRQTYRQTGCLTCPCRWII